jgi:hypothetical protein
MPHPPDAISLILVCLFPALTGCALPATVVLSAAAPVAQAGASSYIDNELITAINHPLNECERAVQRALADLQFDHRLTRGTGPSRYLLAHDLDDTPVEIRLQAVTPVLTRLSIRVGFWGDQAISRALLTQIERELGHPPHNPS